MNAVYPGNGTMAVDGVLPELHNGATWLICSGYFCSLCPHPEKTANTGTCIYNISHYTY